MTLDALTATAIVATLGVFAGCKDDPATSHSTIVKVDGSSTVYPISEAMAEEFQTQSDAHVTIGVSGTGGGFKKFCRGETDISDASRPITPGEIKKCRAHGIDYIEVPVAYDGITVILNPANDWVDQMTVGELHKLWAPAAQNKLTKWSQIRSGWPDKPIHLYGPGIDSGTYDYFTQAIVGKEHSSRGDFTNSEDDNVIVKGVANDVYGLGFLGYAYFDENRDTLRAAPIMPRAADQAVSPSTEAIANGVYQPLSRPLFIYVNKHALSKKAVADFVDYYLGRGTPLVDEVGYVALPQQANKLARRRVAERTTGSVFGGHGAKVGVTVEALLRSEKKAAKSADDAPHAGADR